MAPPKGTKHPNRRSRTVIYPNKISFVLNDAMQDTLTQYSEILGIGQPDVLRALLVIPPNTLLPLIDEAKDRLPTINERVNNRFLVNTEHNKVA